MVKPKPKSKRTPVRLRHKIEKAGAAKQRKQRKLSKANPEWRSRLKKDPGIPNLFPYKDKLLHEIEEKKRLKEEESLQKRNEAKTSKMSAAVMSGGDAPLDEAMSLGEEDLIDDEDVGGEVADNDSVDTSNPMAALLASAKARAVEYNGDSDQEDDQMEEDDYSPGPSLPSVSISSKPRSQESSRRAYDTVFKTVLSSADILLYVLDARDPSGTRSSDIERQVMAADAGSKRLILILNKIDLVPPAVLKAWLVYLRRSFPTLPLRASTPAPKARTFDHKALTVKGTSETLLRALKTYAANKQLKRSITVGVIGYPNVGKSSVINALTSRLSGSSRARSTACPVGAEAGITTALREVKIDNKLKLLDSPGIVFPSSSPSTDQHNNKASAAHLTLLNALPPKHISDPLPAVSLLLSRLSATPSLFSSLLAVYDLPPLMTSPNGDLTTDFLLQVARKRGRLGKGGIPNLVSAAMTVLVDWRDGRISGWVDAPAKIQMDDRKLEDTDGKEIVQTWGKEFKLEGLWGDDDDDDGRGEVEMVDG